MGNQNKFFRGIRLTIARLFNLHLEKANEADVVQSIKKGVEFRGPNLWTLIFAIFIASIGLNVNSTAVIIGAMLISPLMGPIMGIGLGIAVIDIDLVKKGSRNLLTATLISIATSALYFWITPLHDAQSELLARTTPSIWDVFIAFFGGLAGIVASTRKEKSNVIPGVAIATALMPPLCTAGFGLASGNFYYFLGAIYLYFINSVFICLSTYLIVRFLNFRKVQFENQTYGKKVSRYILLIVTAAVIPSIYLAYKIVDKSIFESNAQAFVNNQFRFKNTQVVNKTFRYRSDSSEIDLLLIGQTLPQLTIDTISQKLNQYRLNDAKLVVRQGLDAKQQIDFSQIKASILEDVFKEDSARNSSLQETAAASRELPDLRAELKALYPGLMYYTGSRSIIYRTDTLATDTITLFVANFSKAPTRDDRLKMQQWLKERLQTDSVRLIVQ
ncbi:TIGR00341 family protein [Niabella ginsenosidivorans]|uniref:TIGR00341 family protein n=1 Tax=Niabella ginsenosidivorans TaxID=1176587 RepID=A0A1A9I0Y0_9BACT|nr:MULTISPECIES: TIGR00341 family protein [Niabella]ANH81173.1 TIGR00341 family protein [Niabella ginsenosidivorans]MBZ4191579.1 TIGR00341 family protein [Niabella beijingensis]